MRLCVNHKRSYIFSVLARLAICHILTCTRFTLHTDARNSNCWSFALPASHISRCGYFNRFSWTISADIVIVLICVAPETFWSIASTWYLFVPYLAAACVFYYFVIFSIFFFSLRLQHDDSRLDQLK